MGLADTRGKRQSKGVQPAGLCPLSTRHADHHMNAVATPCSGQQAELEQTSSRHTCCVWLACLVHTIF